MTTRPVFESTTKNRPERPPAIHSRLSGSSFIPRTAGNVVSPLGTRTPAGATIWDPPDFRSTRTSVPVAALAVKIALLDASYAMPSGKVTSGGSPTVVSPESAGAAGACAMAAVVESIAAKVIDNTGRLMWKSPGHTDKAPVCGTYDLA